MKVIKVLKGLFTQLLYDERGQSTVEYILMLSAVVMIALKFKKTFGTTMEGLVGNLDNKIKDSMNE